jgi:hypothetical protein
MAIQLRAHGLAVRTAPGWEAEIYRRRPASGERTHPIVHAATFPLPGQRGDFGSGAVDRMGPDDAMVVLFEHEPEARHTPLFARRGVPHPRSTDFSRHALQRTLAGQSGWQSFFSVGDRAFCLYVVVGSHYRRAGVLPRVHAMIDGLGIESGQPSGASA